MGKTDQPPYDAVVIGAGIGGLVCGCFLAKAGMKVMIAERHHKPGGYCTSFRRNGFLFDAAPHCFGSYRQEGMMRKILQEIGVDRRLRITRPDPSDVINTPDYSVSFWNDYARTVDEFQAAFPSERTRLGDFFNLLRDSHPSSFAKLRRLTFKALLDLYFNDEKLKALLSLPFLGIGALPPSMISAFVGAKLYSEFLFDGGYYPEGGMQALSDVLAERFRELGGDLRLSTTATKITVRDAAVSGVTLDTAGFVQARQVISDCDARQTFLELLDGACVDRDFRAGLEGMTPSMSNFIVYLGLDEAFTPPCTPGTFFFFSEHYDIEKMFHDMRTRDQGSFSGIALRIGRDASTLTALILAPFKNAAFWKENKAAWREAFIDVIEKRAVPGLSKHIVCRDAATPQTLFRYTLNYEGASLGWAAMPEQLAVPSMRKPLFIGGLYLAGHWTTLGLGISGTAYVGYGTAKMILIKGKK